MQFKSAPIWTHDHLQAFVRRELDGIEIFLLSQREPYVHQRKDSGFKIERPAGGLITALEPVMSACAGTWIAHGNGSADWQTVSDQDHISVPPNDPAYTLRRIYLSEDEINGHYFGLCNQALWPLCNHAHVRPVFRQQDWHQYEAVNKRFCQAVVQEAKTDSPLVLVQDYHLALVPHLLRCQLPHSTIVMFWHIPWPHPKAFSIFPWRERLLKGLVASDVLGFQTSEHKQYFIDALHESSTELIECPHIQAYPISVAWPCPADWIEASVAQCRCEILSTHQIGHDLKIGLGVDRLDYVKGILERLSSIERLFEVEPHWIGRFTFIQILSPSRMKLPEYKNYRLSA